MICCVTVFPASVTVTVSVTVIGGAVVVTVSRGKVTVTVVAYGLAAIAKLASALVESVGAELA